MESGLTPDLDAADLSPAVKQILKHSIDFDWDAIARIKPTPSQFHEMTTFLEHFMNKNL